MHGPGRIATTIIIIIIIIIIEHRVKKKYLKKNTHTHTQPNRRLIALDTIINSRTILLYIYFRVHLQIIGRDSYCCCSLAYEILFFLSSYTTPCTDQSREVPH